MNTKTKQIIYTSLFGLLLLTIILFSYSKYLNNKKTLTNKEIKVENKLISLMIETSRGSGEYKESNSTKWPSKGYIFNSDLSNCENGSILTYNENNNTVSVKTNKSDRCFIYFDIRNDITVSVSNVSEIYGKIANISCESNGANYNIQYNRVELSSTNNKYERCVLNYTERTNKTYLNNYVTNLAGTTQGTGKVVSENVSYDKSSFSAENILEQDGYNVLTNIMSNSDTNSIFTWDNTNKTWTSNNHTDSTKATMTFKVSVAGQYQVCYKHVTESDYDYARFYKNDTSILNLKGISTSTFRCSYLGELSTSDIIKVTYEKDSSGSTSPDNIIFYLQDGTFHENIETITDTRYEGKDPNNYIWFNNELWRIIGVFGSSSHGQSGKNLVKIIKNDSLGGLAWDKPNYNNWESARLNKLLNGVYYNAGKESGGTNCYGYSSVSSNCDYTKMGIQSGYREMIQNVTWKLGGYSSSSIISENFYKNERGTTVYGGNAASTTGYIGLMYPSDYGYSVLSSSCARTTNLSSYSTSSCAGQSWLYGQGNEWLLTSYISSSSYAFYLNSNGSISNSYTEDGLVIRPVLYLNNLVYYIDGDGSLFDPLVIGM